MCVFIFVPPHTHTLHCSPFFCVCVQIMCVDVCVYWWGCVCILGEGYMVQSLNLYRRGLVYVGVGVCVCVCVCVLETVFNLSSWVFTAF